jgi:hypothetical protein
LGYEPQSLADDGGNSDLDGSPGQLDAAQVDATPPDDAAPSMVTEVQTGTTTPASAGEDVPIQPVFLDQSFVVCSRQSSSSLPNLNNVRCQLTDGSTLHLESEALDATGEVSWSVVEVPGAVVQRGTTSFAIADISLDVAINAVDRTRSFVLLSSSADLGAIDNDERTVFMGALTSDSSLRISRGIDSIAGVVDWQVVELPSAAVQSGTTVMGVGVTNLVEPLSTIDPSRTFVTYTSEVNKDTDGAEAVFMSRSSLSATDITFTRQSGVEDLTLSWFAVELPVGSTVFSLEGQTTAPHDQLEVDIANASITGSMFALTKVEIGSGTSRSALGAASLTTTLTNGNLHLERNVSDGSPLFHRTTVIDIVMP